MKAIRHARLVSLWECHEPATSVESANIDLEVHCNFSLEAFFDSSGNGVVLRCFCARGKTSLRSVLGGLLRKGQTPHFSRRA